MRYLLPLLLLSTTALADDRTTCPDANPCKVLTFTEQEEKIMMDARGILATAAQGRALELGALATYFQQKFAKAPAGDAKPVDVKAPDPAVKGNTGITTQGQKGDNTIVRPQEEPKP